MEHHVDAELREPVVAERKPVFAATSVGVAHAKAFVTVGVIKVFAHLCFKMGAGYQKDQTTCISQSSSEKQNQ